MRLIASLFVGILSQGITSSLDEMLPAGHNFTTYIGAAYVKWVEAAGARAVPIDVHKPELFYEVSIVMPLFKLLQCLTFIFIDDSATSPTLCIN